MSQREPFLGKLHQYLPGIPKPAEKEDPVTEQLTHAHFIPDHRPQAEKPKVHNLIPRYNTLYGTDRVEGSWRSLIDASSTGAFIALANPAIQRVAVALTIPPQWRLDQWPGAVNLYLCIRQISICPQVPSGATVPGSVRVSFEDTAGRNIPLGVFISNQSFNQDDINLLINTPFTDPNNQSVGTILVQLANTVTAIVYDFQMSFSGAYMIPQLTAGYEQPLGEHVHHDERLHIHHN